MIKYLPACNPSYLLLFPQSENPVLKGKWGDDNMIILYMCVEIFIFTYIIYLYILDNYILDNYICYMFICIKGLKAREMV